MNRWNGITTSRVTAVSATLLLLVVVASSRMAAGEQVRVRNAGVPGQNTAEGRSRFLADVVRFHPQLVVLYFGMNDSVNEKKELSLEAYLLNMDWMITTARRSGIVPVVVTIQHVDELRLLQRHPASAYGAEGPNGRIDRYNAALLKLAAQRGVAVADFTPVLDHAGGPTEAMSGDGVHLAAAGYRLLAETVFRAMPEAKNMRRVVCMGDSLTYGTPLRTSSHNSAEVYPSVFEALLNGTGG